MRQKLYDYLQRRPSGAAPDELLPLVFAQAGRNSEIGNRFLRTLLGADGRFVWDEADGTWRVCAAAPPKEALAETTFVVVDVETTSRGTAATEIIEIGAARVCGGRVLEEFSELVSGGVPVPAFVRGLTGIDDRMLATAPPLREVWPRFLRFLGEDVLVAHNAVFDLALLNAAATALSGAALANRHLCTLRLARRLLPEVPRRGLDALAAHFGIPEGNRHRALGDVRITVEILFQLLERMAVVGIVRLEQALDLQGQARDGLQFRCLLPRDTVRRLQGIAHRPILN